MFYKLKNIFYILKGSYLNMLLNNSHIKTKLKNLWNIFWSGGIANPLTAIEQITYLLFIKRIDDLDQRNIKEAEGKNIRYRSKFYGTTTIVGFAKPIEKSTLRWSYFRDMDDEEMLSHVQLKVFPFIKTLNDENAFFTKHMKNAVFIIPRASLLKQAVKVIDEIYDLLHEDEVAKGHAFQDIQGDLYELLINEIATSGKNGQFRTPRQIIKLMTELVKPKFGDKIADPACGTGGFLLDSYQYIVTNHCDDLSKIQCDEDGFKRSSIARVLTEDNRCILEKNLFGYDIDVTMVRLGLMNLMMHGIDNPQIDYMDTLSKEYNDTNQYDIIMANPPFTGSIDKDDIDDKIKIGTTKTEVLFLNRIFSMLRDGGTASVIIPQGVLFGLGKGFVNIRKIILEKAELKAVIMMPSGIFKPYAGVSTAILVFTKGKETRDVWFYEMENDGRTLDDKRTKLEGYGDLQDIILRYEKRNTENNVDRKSKYFCVSKNEIVENNYSLNMNDYKESSDLLIEYEEPSEIFNKLILLENEISTDLTNLSNLWRSQYEK
jgi:type I restriction enzyme M protein